MKKDNKKALYESIMTSVAKEVKKTLNESEYPEVYTNERGQKIAKDPDAKDYIPKIGRNIASILLNNVPAKQLDIMISAITDGVYMDKHISPIFAINCILNPLCNRQIYKEDLF